MRLLRTVALVLSVQPLAAQARIVRDAEVRATPEGSVIATLAEGTVWQTGGSRGGFTEITINAWVDATRFAGRRESFPESVGGTGGLRLRAEPSLSGKILGTFEAGAGVRVLERRGTWARVEREAWILSSAIAPGGAQRPPVTATATAPLPAPAPTRAPTRPVNEIRRPVADSEPTRAAAQPTRPPDGSLRTTRATPLSIAPGADAIGRLDSGTVVEPVARDRGWVRVRVDAWVPDSLLAPTDSAYRRDVTAADLRLDPGAYRGRVVRWRVQAVSLQVADPLRRDLQPEEPYLLALGPDSENAVLYLAIPPSLLAQARTLTPMAPILITARIRSARSEPTGAPVLDLLTLVKR